MSKRNQKPNWAEGHWREMLVEPRRFMWLPEAIANYAKWMGLHQGMTAVDVGCGLGYLGYTYWPYFGRDGKYIGIDTTEDLLADAARAAKEWAQGGETEFLPSDVYALPLEDDGADWVMCQTLMMHLDRPQQALQEMIRVLKPGGLMMCKEPDNLASSLARHYFIDFSREEYLLFARVRLTMHEGRKKLGRGDDAIGRKIPHLLHKLGMTEIDIRMNEQVLYLEPPYDGDQQQHRLKRWRKIFGDPTEREFLRQREREEFMAGDGNPEDLQRLHKIMNTFSDRAARQMDNLEFAACGGDYFYVIKARKPNIRR